MSANMMTLRQQIEALRFRDGDIDEITPENIAIQTGYNAALDDILAHVGEAEAERPTHRICFVGTCGKPDVNAPDDGTWPTCSKYPPACVEHLTFVPPPQRRQP